MGIRMTGDSSRFGNASGHFAGISSMLNQKSNAEFAVTQRGLKKSTENKIAVEAAHGDALKENQKYNAAQNMSAQQAQAAKRTEPVEAVNARIRENMKNMNPVSKSLANSAGSMMGYKNGADMIIDTKPLSGNGSSGPNGNRH